MERANSNSKLYLILNTLIFSLLLGSQLLFAQDRMVRGHVTIGELNQPGVGGIYISIKGTSSKVVTDNDGEYRIKVSDNETVLLYSYAGMVTQEILVGNQTRINVDLDKITYETGQTVYATQIGVVLNKNATAIEKNVAEVLKKRLQRDSAVSVTISDALDESAELNIYLGLTGTSERLDNLCKTNNIILPGIKKPYAEGFAVNMLTQNNAPVIVAVGADNRGVLYAVGEILRQMKSDPHAVRFSSFYVSTAPAYKFRGGIIGQGGTMKKVTKARLWTKEEYQDANLDLALAGANCFYAPWSGGDEYDFYKSFDLLTSVAIRPNQLNEEFPKEWKSEGLSNWEGDNWVCPSIPEAREALLKQWRAKLETMAGHEILRFPAGDPGGCPDERCRPWGNAFVQLCEDISKIALELHPDLNIQIINQDLSNEGDEAIFDYLTEEPREWLYGMSYGPGSNAMSWYFRHKLNDDMFEYPGYGWLNRYLAETLNAIPKDQKIVHFSDITHWIFAQYNVETPERNIMKSYGRRTWHTRPEALYEIFQAIMPFSEGDIIYHEGYHDHFNQYFWYRLLWNPHLTSEEVVKEYSILYVGEEASDLMVKAIYQLEKNLVNPLATNYGISRYYALVREAGQLMPEYKMENDHIWRLHMQKAALDKYNQLKLQRELFKEERVRQLLQSAIESGKMDKAIELSLTILTEPTETPEMVAFREEASQLGIESEKIIGVRNVGYFKLENQLRDISGLEDILKKAKKSSSKNEQRKLLESAVKITQKKTN